MAELLAYGLLLHQGVNVRMSGQDCSRGTFSHRHAIITDIKTGREHLVLGQLHADQGMCRVFDSPLSEAGVLGFEFGQGCRAGIGAARPAECARWGEVRARRGAVSTMHGDVDDGRAIQPAGAARRGDYRGVERSAAKSRKV